MKKLLIFSLSLVTCSSLISCKQTETNSSDNTPSEEKEKPVQHLKLADITSKDTAVEVMKSTTQDLKGKTKLDVTEMNEIHIITYSLEKAIAYFTENITGDQQALAKKMAEVVEEVHLNSENHRTEKTKAALEKYYPLEEAFRNGL